MTPDFVSFLVGLGTGAVIAWLARADTVRHLREQVHWSREQEAIATDRLVHAWKEGATVPPRPPPEPVKLQPLPTALQEEVNQWEDAETRVEVELRIRRLMEQGLGQEAILLQLGEPRT